MMKLDLLKEPGGKHTHILLRKGYTQFGKIMDNKNSPINKIQMKDRLVVPQR